MKSENKTIKLNPQDTFLQKTLLKLIPHSVKPTYFSIARIILTPFAAYEIAYGNNIFVALLIYVLVSSTDLIDGALARTRNQITEIGRVLDPVADKLLLFFSSVFLLPYFGKETLLLILIFMEIGTIVFGFLFFKKGANMSSNIFGKIKMNFQVIGIIFFLLAKYNYRSYFVGFGELFLYFSILFHLIAINVFLLKIKPR